MAALEDFDWGAHSKRLTDIYGDAYKELFDLAFGDANDDLPVDVSFDVSNPDIKKAIDSLAAKIKGVSDTTRSDIKALVDKATEGGWDMPKLAKAVREQGDVNSKSRAATVARTESGTAYNVGATYAYEQASVEKVEVFDGDEDEPCASVNGTTQTLEWARENPLGHPNCTRGFAPVLD